MSERLTLEMKAALEWNAAICDWIKQVNSGKIKIENASYRGTYADKKA